MQQGDFLLFVPVIAELYTNLSRHYMIIMSFTIQSMIPMMKPIIIENGNLLFDNIPVLFTVCTTTCVQDLRDHIEMYCSN